MPGRNTLGIVVDFVADKAISSAKALGFSLDTLKQKGGGAATGMSKAGKAAGDFNLALSNLQQGLSMMGRGFLDLASAIKDTIVEMGQAFAEFEVGMARVAIVMGKTGENANLPGLVSEFDEIQEKVVQIGRDTEFSMAQASDAFVNLKQSGLTAAEAVGVIDKTMAFSSASAGTVELADAADTATSAVAALGLNVQETNQFIDQMVKTSNVTKLSLREFRQVFRSMGAAGVKFKNTTKEEFLAVAGALRQMNRSAAQAGNDIQGFARNLGTVDLALQGIGRGAKLKKLFLDKLGIRKEDLKDTAGEFRPLIDIIENVQKRVEESGLSAADAGTFLQKAFGTQMSSNVILLTKKFGEQSKEFESVRDLAGEVAKANGDATAAQGAFLETMTGQIQVLGGSLDLLKVTFFSSIAELVKPILEGLIEVVNAISAWGKENPKLAKTIMLVAAGISVAAAAIGGLLLAMGAAALLAQVLNPLILKMGGNFTIAGVGAAFFRTVVAPIAGIMKGLVLSMLPMVATAALVFVAYKENFGGLKDFIDGWAKDIRDLFDVIMPLLSGEGISVERWEALSPRVQKIATFLVVLKGRVEDLLAGIKEGFLPVWEALSTVLGGFIKIVIGVLQVLGILSTELGISALTGDDSVASFRAMGKVIGFVIGMFVAWRAALIAWKVAMVAAKVAAVAFNAVVKIQQGIVLAAKGAMLIFKGVMFLVTGAFGVLKAAALGLHAVLLANPIILVATAIIAAITLLVVFWDEITAAMAVAWEFLWDLVTFVVFAALAILDNVLQLFGTSLSEVWNTITDTALAAWEVLTRVAVQVWTTLVDTVVALWEAFVFFWKGVWAVSVAVVTAIWDAIVFAIIDPIIFIVTTSTDLLVGFITFWIDLWTGIFSFIGEFFSTLWGLISDGWMIILEGTKELWRFLWEPILNAGTVLFEAGANIMTSLWDGLKSVWTGIADWMSDTWDDVTGLWPFSPAKHGPLKEKPPEKAGANIATLFQEGFKDQAPSMVASVKATMGLASDVLSDVFPGIPQIFTPEGPETVQAELDNVIPFPLGGRDGNAARASLASPPVLSPELTTLSASIADSGGAAAQLAAEATAPATPQAQPIQVTIGEVNFGDIKLNADALTGAEADRFTRQIAGMLGDLLEEELSKRNIG